MCGNKILYEEFGRLLNWLQFAGRTKYYRSTSGSLGILFSIIVLNQFIAAQLVVSRDHDETCTINLEVDRRA